MSEHDHHSNTERVLAAAREHGLTLEVVRFQEGTRTAEDAARAVGCPLGAIVKSLVLDSDDGPVLVLTSGAHRADAGKVAAALGTTGVRRADAATVRAATGFPIGGTAPLALAEPLPVLCDADLLGYEEVWAAAGTPDTVFAVTPQALVAATGATVGDIAEG